ncbi:MAG: hypothetical protein IJ509_01165 [Bacilli bacterium]|nr:hypothetical protein [Bacilli bacterium]
MSHLLETKNFQSLIGGTKVSVEEKEKNLKKIKEAIIKNNQGDEPTKISNQTFAASYPESLDLVKDYYDSLYNAKVVNIIVWDGRNYVNKNKKIAEYRSRIRRNMVETLIIFAPQLINKEITEIETMFGISAIEVASILNNYKKIISNVSKIEDLNKKQEKYRMAQIIYEEIVINGLKKQEFCQKYNISSQSVDTHIEILKEINIKLYDEVKKVLGQNINKRYHSLRELTLKIGTYCKDKITVNTANGQIQMPFTLLDYYSITNYSPKIISEFINTPSNFNSNDKDEILKKNMARKMLQTCIGANPYVSKEIILKNNMVAGRVGNIIEMNEEICDEIFALFEKEGIPKCKKAVEKAFQRYALGQQFYL